MSRFSMCIAIADSEDNEPFSYLSILTQIVARLNYNKSIFSLDSCEFNNATAGNFCSMRDMYFI